MTLSSEFLKKGPCKSVKSDLGFLQGEKPLFASFMAGKEKPITVKGDLGFDYEAAHEKTSSKLPYVLTAAAGRVR